MQVFTREAELAAIRVSRTWRAAGALGGPGRAFALQGADFEYAGSRASVRR